MRPQPEGAAADQLDDGAEFAGRREAVAAGGSGGWEGVGRKLINSLCPRKSDGGLVASIGWRRRFCSKLSGAVHNALMFGGDEGHGSHSLGKEMDRVIFGMCWVVEKVILGASVTSLEFPCLQH